MPGHKAKKNKKMPKMGGKMMGGEPLRKTKRCLRWAVVTSAGAK